MGPMRQIDYTEDFYLNKAKKLFAVLTRLLLLLFLKIIRYNNSDGFQESINQNYRQSFK